MSNQPQRPQLREFIDAEDASQAFTYIQEHQFELLNDATLAELQELQTNESDPARRSRLQERLQLLHEFKALQSMLENASPEERFYYAFMSANNITEMIALTKAISEEDLDALERTAETKLAQAPEEEATGIRQRLTHLQAIRASGKQLLQETAAQTHAIAGTLIEWINTPDWDASESYLRQHADVLLTDQGQATLELLRRLNDDNPQIQQHIILLKRCRKLDIAEAYAELRAAMQAAESTDRDPILQAVIQFLRAGSDEEARELLTEQGDLLLTLDAGHHLQEFIEAGRQHGDDEMLARFEARLALWKEVRQGQSDG